MYLVCVERDTRACSVVRASGFAEVSNCNSLKSSAVSAVGVDEGELVGPDRYYQFPVGDFYYVFEDDLGKTTAGKMSDPVSHVTVSVGSIHNGRFRERWDVYGENDDVSYGTIAMCDRLVAGVHEVTFVEEEDVGIVTSVLQLVGLVEDSYVNYTGYVVAGEARDMVYVRSADAKRAIDLYNELLVSEFDKQEPGGIFSYSCKYKEDKYGPFKYEPRFLVLGLDVFDWNVFVLLLILMGLLWVLMK